MSVVGIVWIVYLVEDFIYCLFFCFQGSSAFVVGWMAFADLFFNGVTIKIIQEATPSSNDRYTCMMYYCT